MKLSKKQIKELETVLSNLNRAYSYLMADEVVGIAVKISPERALGSDYTVNNPACVETCANTPLNIGLRNKHAGSDIAGFSFAVGQLKNFLERNQ